MGIILGIRTRLEVAILVAMEVNLDTYEHVGPARDMCQERLRWGVWGVTGTKAATREILLADIQVRAEVCWDASDCDLEINAIGIQFAGLRFHQRSLLTFLRTRSGFISAISFIAFFFLFPIWLYGTFTSTTTELCTLPSQPTWRKITYFGSRRYGCGVYGS
jgi:hypothetical protein